MGGTRHAVMLKRLKIVTFLLLMGAMVAACVQPIEPTPMPSPTVPATPTLPAPPTDAAQVAPTFNPQLIANWLSQNFGDVVNNISLFIEYQAGPDHIIGFTYQDNLNNNCAGFVLTTLATSTIWNGDRSCAPRGTAIIASPLLFSLTNNEFYVATFGWVDPDVIGDAGGVAIQFPNGNSATQLLVNNGFVILQPGLDFPNQLVLSDPNGNLITQIPIQ